MSAEKKRRVTNRELNLTSEDLMGFSNEQANYLKDLSKQDSKLCKQLFEFHKKLIKSNTSLADIDFKVYEAISKERILVSLSRIASTHGQAIVDLIKDASPEEIDLMYDERTIEFSSNFSNLTTLKPIHLACFFGMQQTVKKILSEDLTSIDNQINLSKKTNQITQKSSHIKTPLYFAILGSNLELCRYLIDNEAIINFYAGDKYSFEVIMSKIDKNHPDSLQVITEIVIPRLYDYVKKSYISEKTYGESWNWLREYISQCSDYSTFIPKDSSKAKHILDVLYLALENNYLKEEECLSLILKFLVITINSRDDLRHLETFMLQHNITQDQLLKDTGMGVRVNRETRNTLDDRYIDFTKARVQDFFLKTNQKIDQLQDLQITDFLKDIKPGFEAIFSKGGIYLRVGWESFATDIYCKWLVISLIEKFCMKDNVLLDSPLARILVEALIRHDLTNTLTQLLDKGYTLIEAGAYNSLLKHYSIIAPYRQFFLDQSTLPSDYYEQNIISTDSYKAGLGNNITESSYPGANVDARTKQNNILAISVPNKLLKLEELTNEENEFVESIDDKLFAETILVRLKNLLSYQGLSTRYRPHSESLDANQDQSVDLDKLQMYKVNPRKQAVIADLIVTFQKKHQELKDTLSMDLSSLYSLMFAKKVKSDGVSLIPCGMEELFNTMKSGLQSTKVLSNDEMEQIQDAKEISERISNFKSANPLLTAEGFLSAVRDKSCHQELLSFLSQIDDFEVAQQSYIIASCNPIVYVEYEPQDPKNPNAKRKAKDIIFEDKQRYRYSYHLMQLLNDSLMWKDDRDAFNELYRTYLMTNSQEFALKVRNKLKPPSLFIEDDEKMPDRSRSMEMDEDALPLSSSSKPTSDIKILGQGKRHR